MHVLQCAPCSCTVEPPASACASGATVLSFGSTTGLLQWRLPADQGSTPIDLFRVVCLSKAVDNSIEQSYNDTVLLLSPQKSGHIIQHNVTGLRPYSSITCNISASNPGGSESPSPCTFRFQTRKAGRFKGTRIFYIRIGLQAHLRVYYIITDFGLEWCCPLFP